MLADRAARGLALEETKRALADLIGNEADTVLKLRALWSLYVIGGTDSGFLRGLLDHEHESIRAWAIRLLTDDLPLDTVFSRRVGTDVDLPADLLAKFASLARDDPSPLVRLVLASTLQRLPLERRIDLARALLSHAEDSSDHNLPALIWTGLIPLADTEANAEALASLASDCRQPPVVRLIARRLGEDVDSRPAPLNALLAAAAKGPAETRSAVVCGLADALAGSRKAGKPDAWAGLSGRPGRQFRPSPGHPGARIERAVRGWACFGRGETTGTR